MRSIETKPLADGMVPCLKCQEGGRRAFTYIATFCPPDAPDEYAVRHWCDTGGSDASWHEAKRYCHGYVGPTYSGPLMSTKEETIAEWNRQNSVIPAPILSFLHTIKQMLGFA